jgi:hypothetical protein
MTRFSQIQILISAKDTSMKINLILAKFFKFVTYVLFMFMTLVYFGMLVVLPLDLMTQVIRIFAGLGFPTALAAMIGMAALGYVGLQVYRMPQLYQLVLEIGLQLLAFGREQVKRFEPLIEEAQSSR